MISDLNLLKYVYNYYKGLIFLLRLLHVELRLHKISEAPCFKSLCNPLKLNGYDMYHQA
jgi:hypothetical protein